MTQPTSSSPLSTPSHSALHNFHVNVKMFGAVGNGTTDDTATIQAAMTAAAGSPVFFPQGNYRLADGSTLTLVGNQQICGAGREATTISVKDAYAFTGTAVGGVDLRDLYVSVRSGATSGGAVKLDSTNWARLNRVGCTSVSTCLTPAIYLKGTVGSHVDQCQVEGMTAHGIRLDDTGATLAFCNANSIYRSRVNSVQGSTNAGIYVAGTGNRVRDCTIEANRGYGMSIADNWNIVEACWFEDNSNHNLYLPQSKGTQVIGNKFHYNHGDVGTADHINLTGTANQRAMNRIEGNIFQDASSSGVAIRIGSGAEFTAVMFNRGAGLEDGATVVDGGSYTTIVGNDNTSLHPDDIQMAGQFRQLNAKTAIAAAATGGDPGSANAVFTVRDDGDDNYFMVGVRGIPIFRTGDITQITGSDELNTNSFALYWDQAAGQIKARVRNNSGVYSTIVLG